MISIKELKELHERATPGDWFNGRWTGTCRKKGHEVFHPGRSGLDPCVYQYEKVNIPEEWVSGPDRREMICADDWGSILGRNDAKLIVTLRNSLPEIIERLEDADRMAVYYANKAITCEHCRGNGRDKHNGGECPSCKGSCIYEIGTIAREYKKKWMGEK